MNIKVLELLDRYDEILYSGDPSIRLERIGDMWEFFDERRKHGRWMIENMREKVDVEKWSERKLNRWLGFIQGLLWSLGQRGLLDLRSDSRDLPDSMI